VSSSKRKKKAPRKKKKKQKTLAIKRGIMPIRNLGLIGDDSYAMIEAIP